MYKRNTNNCSKDTSAEADKTSCSCESAKKFNIKITYLEYLKEKYNQKYFKTKEFPKLIDLERNEKPNVAEKLKVHSINYQENELEVVTEDPSEKPKKTDIFKEVFEFRSKKPVDEEVDGFVWLEDPQLLREKSFKWKLRKYFLQNPELIKKKQPQKSEDHMIDDFVVIEPEREQEVHKNKDNIKQAFVDFIAGSLAGIAQVYVSQPLDTVKVKQQTFPKLYKNMFKCFLHTYRKNGIVRGLYAGTVPAVIASVVENSVLFAAYGACQEAVTFAMEIDKVNELSALGNGFAGCLAAFFSSFTLCPTELIKCKLQAVHEMKHYVAKDSKAVPITAFKMTTDIFTKEGIAGFYRGLTSTFVREMPGFFFFFGGYEVTREYLTQPGQSKEDIGPFKTMCAGAVGGIALWTSTFPADVIKSRIQINNLKGSMLSVGSDILRKEGILAFYNGLLPSILRTIPATATLFLVFENTKKVLADKF